MARFHGNVGFILVDDNQETGIVDEVAVEKPHYGKILEHTRRWQASDMVTDDLTLNNQIAITATDYTFRHLSALKYVCWMRCRWSVTGMRVKGPEIILTLGGIWNGKVPAEPAG